MENTDLPREFPLWERLEKHADAILIQDEGGEKTGRQLRDGAACLSAHIVRLGIKPGDRVLMCVPPGAAYVETLLAIWRSGGVALPLALSHPPAEWTYFAKDVEARHVIAHGRMEEPIAAWAKREGLHCVLHSELDRTPQPLIEEACHTKTQPEDDAMILYTSGTTSRPKGVVFSHGQLECHIQTLCDAWQWTSTDRVLHVLPLHHVHGIVNLLLCSLWSGARCEFVPRFQAEDVWRRFREDDLTVFMAVPTIYQKLMDAFEEMKPDDQKRSRHKAASFRLMVSGSAALPESLFRQWERATSQTLLERYGMTEIGMALSNPYDGPRLPGTVGAPLPGVEVRLVDEDGAEVKTEPAQGEIQVKGPGVFKRYWRRESATKEAFTAQGWFRTGDMAERKDGIFRILGRNSVDIIKTGGYKVSALEIESVFLQHPAIRACAVVGLPDTTWGEQVVLVLEKGTHGSVSEDVLWAFAREHLAPYKIPKSVQMVDTLPRNALGKLQKTILIERLKQG